MALIEILPDNNPIMRKTSRSVRHVDQKLRKLVEDMYETMVENWGVGLAAVQVGVLKRLFIYEIPKRRMHGYETCAPDREVVEQLEAEEAESVEIDGDVEHNEDVEPDEMEDIPDSGYTGNYIVCINPRIIEREGAYIEEEGCLSKAGWVAKVERAIKVTFQAYDLDMNKFERTVEGLEARCVQHEIDHMDGILFTDRAIQNTLREIKDDEDEKVEGDDETVIDMAEEFTGGTEIRDRQDSTIGRESL